MTLRPNALFRTPTGFSGFHSHRQPCRNVLAIHMCQTLMRSYVFYSRSPRHKFAGRGLMNDLSIIQIIQNCLLVGIGVTASILTSYIFWNSSSLRPSNCCLRVLRVYWWICLRSGEKGGKCCGHTSFSDLTSIPISQMLRSRRRQVRKMVA